VRTGAFIFAVCAFGTAFYVIKADVSWKAKGLVLAIYVASFFAHRVVETAVPVGLLIQAALAIYYIIYFKYT